MPSLPPSTILPALTKNQQTQVLDLLFEPSPPLHNLALPIFLRRTTFPDYPTLISTVQAQLTTLLSSSDPADSATLSEILNSHPRLGAKKVDSEQSRAEQAQLQGDSTEGEELAALNSEYEDVFKGLRYVVFVNGRPRNVIMQDMRARIDRADLQAEKKAAVDAMCDIARDRAGKLQIWEE